MTTKDAIKLLPLDEELKLQIINRFDSMNPAQRLTIARIAWNTYDYLFAEKLDQNMQGQIEKGMEDKADFAPDGYFYENLIKKTRAEMEQQTTETASKVDLENARQAMKRIMDEITASGKKQ